MERKDFRPVSHYVTMSTDIAEILAQLDICYPSHHHASGNYYYVPGKSNYPYTWLTRSKTDPTRISGYPFANLVSKAFQYTDAYGAFHNLTEVFEPSDLDRRTKGTHVKVGRLVEFLTGQENPELGDRLATFLRRTSGVNLDHLQVSDKPSEIYTLRSEFTSCMKGQYKERFRLYDELEGTKILYTTLDGALHGRALLHDNVVVLEREFDTYRPTDKRIKVMDRIYSKDKTVEMQFVQWAVANDYWYKSEQSMGHEIYLHSSVAERQRMYLAIPCHDLIESGFEEVPYVDTFAHYFRNKGFLANTDNMIESYYPDTCLKDTGGQDSENFLVEGGDTCNNCGCRVSESEGRWQNDHFWCEDCFSERFSYCEGCDDYGDSDEFVRVQGRHGENYVCPDCINNNYILCDECGEYFRDVVEVDGDYVCEGCLENEYSYCDECDCYVKDVRHLGVACEDCASLCSDCGGAFLNSDLTECGLCANCVTEEVCEECIKSCDYRVEAEEAV